MAAETRDVLVRTQAQEVTMNTNQQGAARRGVADAIGTGGRRLRLVDSMPPGDVGTPAVADLVGRLATVPGLVRPGVSSWDMTSRLPLHPLAVESAYGDPRLLQAIAVPGAAFADRLGAEVVVGAETGGIP